MEHGVVSGAQKDEVGDSIVHRDRDWVFMLNPEARVFACIPKLGYVGVGIVVWNGIPRARFRPEKLLVELETPTDLSSECPSLHKWARLAGNDTSGIGALVAIRNAFFHPVRNKLDVALAVPSCARVEAWALSLLSLEATILTLLKYDGPIYSRLRNGLTREVRVEKPWVLA